MPTKQTTYETEINAEKARIIARQNSGTREAIAGLERGAADVARREGERASTLTGPLQSGPSKRLGAPSIDPRFSGK